MTSLKYYGKLSHLKINPSKSEILNINMIKKDDQYLQKVKTCA